MGWEGILASGIGTRGGTWIHLTDFLVTTSPSGSNRGRMTLRNAPPVADADYVKREEEEEKHVHSGYMCVRHPLVFFCWLLTAPPFFPPPPLVSFLFLIVLCVFFLF